MTPLHIRPAVEADIPQILGFWNPVIRDTTITFSSVLHDTGSVAAQIAQKPVFLVADSGGTVLGFASCAQFRAGSGYVRAMEHTVILAPEARGHGVGRRLMAAMEDGARAAGAHILVAGVSGENAVGLAFHGAVGFEVSGRIREAGYKFGRYLDLVLMQKVL